MLKKILFPVLLFAGSIGNITAQCGTPVTSLNQDFQAFQEDSFPQNCWTSSTMQTMIIDWFGDGNLGSFQITGPGAQNASYLVSPLASFTQPQTITFKSLGAGTVQVGTLAAATDFSTFVPIENYQLYPNSMEYYTVIPVSGTAQHIAFKLLPAATTSHMLLDNIIWSQSVSCGNSLQSFYEDFSSFEIGNASQNCWVGSFDESYLAVSGAESRFVIFTCEPSENINELYLVSPKITDLTGSHTLSFRATGADGEFQAGTMASAYNFNSFIQSGSPVLITPGLIDYTLPLSGPATHHYVALKFSVTAGSQSSIAMLRRIAFDQALSVPGFEDISIKAYPNPVKSVLTLTAVANTINTKIFDLSGRHILTSNSLTIDVSGLAAGVYLLNMETGGKISVQQFIKE